MKNLNSFMEPFIFTAYSFHSFTVNVQRLLGQANSTPTGGSMPKIIRVGVTFPPELLKEFDEIKNKMGYKSRSKAVQDAVRLYVSEKKWIKEEGNQTGVLLMVYDHEAKGLESDLTESQHHHTNLVSSTMHIHLSERDCLETIAVKGKASEIRELSDELATKRGVKILKAMIVSF
jgi:CopG family nickel-responsive transcriptional regulator